MKWFKTGMWKVSAMTRFGTQGAQVNTEDEARKGRGQSENEVEKEFRKSHGGIT
jgi:hypothetical protein